MTARVSCLLPVRAPHVAADADHRRHRGVHDDVAGHVQVGDPLVGVHHRQPRAVGQPRLEGGPDLGAVGQGAQAVEDAAQPVVRRQAGGGRGRRRRSRTPRGKNAVTTWPKMIGSLTFIIVALRCTENSTSSALAARDLLGQERVEGGDPHDGGVDDLAGEDLQAALEDGRSCRPRRRGGWSACRRRAARPTARWRGSRRRPWSPRWSCWSALHAPIECGCLRA